MNKRLVWTEADKKQVYDSRVFSVQETVSISPEGKKGTFYCLSAPNWAIVIPLVRLGTEDHFVMVRQWRHGASELSLEFPGGVIEADENPAMAAARELLEETGLKVQLSDSPQEGLAGKPVDGLEVGALTYLGELSPNPAIMTNRVFIYFTECRDLPKQQTLDEGEYIDVELIPVAEARRGMGKKPFIHALMAAALCLYDAHRNNKTAAGDPAGSQ